MFRKFLVFFLTLTAAAAIGAGAGIGVWEATDADQAAAPAAQAAPTAPVASSTSRSVNSIYESVKNGVVQVSTRTAAQNTPFGPQGQGGATGSGFVIDMEGHVITNQHVVNGAQSVTVTFANGDEVPATVVGADASADVAVLKLNDVPSDLHPLQLGSSKAMKIGDPVVAIGSPFGLQGTVTTGIVSALNRELTAPDGFTIDGAIQTDAAINPGNSGGPLLDGNGRVIGINSQIATQSGGNEGIGYAVPIETARKVADALIAGKTVERPFLGVRLADADNGARIVQVTSGTAAAKAGVQAGDVVTKAGDTDVHSGDDLRRAVADLQPGDKLELTVRRNGTTKTLTVTLGTRPAQSN
ncbi:MAG TPA: trypsin-like peptidase domain-containing protein [Gaiellaceae bacterium]|nr:trypsin-like peptidase domain-containing protein [Gaiellaceae bacterium]